MPLLISPNMELFDASNFVLHRIFGQTAWSIIVGRFAYKSSRLHSGRFAYMIKVVSPTQLLDKKIDKC